MGENTDELEPVLDLAPEGDDNFDDPDLDGEEPEADQTDSASFVDEAERTPDALASPQTSSVDEDPLPLTDQGFTPAPAPRYEAPPSQPAPQLQFYTVQQLSEGVMNGVITEDQKFEQLQLQNRELAKRDAIDAMRQETRTRTLQQQLGEYGQLVPGWDAVGTPANLQATQTYQRLLGLGLGENETTKLLALEQTFGPAHKIRAARASKTRTSAQRDTAQEVGRRGTPPSSQRKADPLSILSLDEKRLYKSYIDKGIYANWKEVRAEVQSAATQTTNPRLRAKHAGLMK